jgi:hypothetical protein
LFEFTCHLLLIVESLLAESRVRIQLHRKLVLMYCATSSPTLIGGTVVLFPTFVMAASLGHDGEWGGLVLGVTGDGFVLVPLWSKFFASGNGWSKVTQRVISGCAA